MNIVIKSLLYALPQRMHRFLYLRGLKLNYKLDRSIQFKIAETQDELEGAFKLIYENEVQTNAVDPSLVNSKGTPILVSPYHALDSTTTIVAKRDDKIIGTLTLIRWGALGVPSKKNVNLKNQLWSGLQIAEVSGVALDPDYKNQIFYHLLKYAYNYCVDLFGVDVLIAGIPEKKSVKAFYESVLQFRPLTAKVNREFSDSNSIRGKNVIYESLNLHEARRSFFKLFSDFSNEKNLYYFFTQHLSPNFKFPKRELYSILDPVMNQKLFKYFYLEKTNAINDIPDHIKPYILKKYGLLNKNPKEPSKRVEVKAKGYCIRSRLKIPVMVKNISMEGFCIHTNIPFIRPGETVDFNFQLGMGININVSGVAVWVDQVNSYGFQVEDSHKSAWSQNLLPSFFSPTS